MGHPVLGEERGEVGGGDDFEVGGHAVVAGAAELGAEDGVGAGDGGGEVDVDVLTGDGVLLDAQGGDGEAVDDVLGVEVEVDFAAGGEDEGGGDEVVGGAGSVGSRPRGLPSPGAMRVGRVRPKA